MKFGKYMFKKFAEYQHVKKVAFANGVETVLGFEKYLKENYNNFNIKKVD